MSATLGRTLRRGALAASLSDASESFETSTRNLFRERRIAAKAKMQVPAKEHRRSRNRRKAAKEDKPSVARRKK